MSIITMCFNCIGSYVGNCVKSIFFERLQLIMFNSVICDFLASLPN